MLRNKAFYFSFKLLLLPLFFHFSLIGCETLPLITATKPKVYSEDQTIKTLSELHQKLVEEEKNIKDKEYQERFGVRQAVQYNLAASAAPTGSDPADLPESSSIVLPAAPTDFKDYGLDYSALLRKVDSQNQEFLGRKLSYLGDIDFQDTTKSVYLVRFDVSINNYIDFYNSLSVFPEEKKFAVAKFRVAEAESIYMLMPEFSSIVAQESLVTSILEDYSGNFGGPIQNVDVNSAGRFQRQLEETLLTVVEHPLQFAIYGAKKDEFLFAFGPRRRLIKRSWINPKRWFGTTYRISHEIQPGPRSCYAIVVVPKRTDNLNISMHYSEKLFDFESNEIPFLDSLERIPFVNAKTTLLSLETLCCQPSKENSALKLMKSKPYPLCKEGKNIEVKEDKRVYPTTLYPKLTNNFLIQSPKPVSSETQVFLGNYLVPQSDITILGKYTLRAIIKADKGFEQEIGKTTPSFQLFSPGWCDRETVGEPINLKKSAGPDKVELVTLSKKDGKAGALISLSTKTTTDLKIVDRIHFGTEELTSGSIASAADKKYKASAKKIELYVPTPPEKNREGEVDVILYVGTSKLITLKFKYN